MKMEYGLKSGYFYMIGVKLYVEIRKESKPVSGKKVTLDNQAESRDILMRLANSIVQYVVGSCCYSSESAAFFATKKKQSSIIRYLVAGRV